MSCLNKKKGQYRRKARKNVFRRKGHIRIPHSVSRRFSRRWLWPAAKCKPQTSSADSTGIVRNMSLSMPLTPEGREDLKLGLAVEALRLCGTVRLTAWGASMLPSIWPGDLLTIETVTLDQLIPGDIVWVRYNQRCYIHRLISKHPAENSTRFITRGDAMPRNDPSVAPAELLGRVMNVQRGNRSFVSSRRALLGHLAVGWILCRSDLLRQLVLRLHTARLDGWKQLSQPGSDSLKDSLSFSGSPVSRHL